MTWKEASELAREIANARDVGWFEAWPSLPQVAGQGRTDHSVSVLDRNNGFRFQIWDREEWAQVSATRRAAQ